jgi:hypothetical protein
MARKYSDGGQKAEFDHQFDNHIPRTGYFDGAQKEVAALGESVAGECAAGDSINPTSSSS